MEPETKTFKLYEEYRKIPFSKIRDMEKYVTKKTENRTCNYSDSCE